MPLTPAKSDPKAAQEVARRLRDPGAFGVTVGDGSRERKTETQKQVEAGRIKLYNPRSERDRLIVLPCDVK